MHRWIPEASLACLPYCRVSWESPVLSLMPLVPRWRYMSDEAKALTKRTAVSALVVLLVLVVFRSLVPLALLAVVSWWAWKAVRR